MPMAAVPPVSLSGGEAGAEDDEEKERADAEVRQLPEHVLRDKKLRWENAIKRGLADRLPDGGKKLRASLDAFCRELARRKPLSEVPHPHTGGPKARAQAGAEDDEEKERADAEVRQLPEHVLRDKKLRRENAIKSGLADRLPDGGKKLRASLDAVCREHARRKPLSEAGAEDDEEKERADAEVRQLPEHVLRDKKLRWENTIKRGLADCLPDGGKKLRASLDAFCRELARRKPLSEVPHPHAGGPKARAQAGAEDDEEKERADAKVRQLSEHVLRDKKLRQENAIKSGLADRLPDGGKKLRASLDAVCRELARRKPLSEVPHPHAGGPKAQAQDEKGCERVVRSRGAESSGMARDSNNGKVTKADFMFSFGKDIKAGVDISSLERTSRSCGKPNTSVKNEGKFCQEKKSCKSSSQPTSLSQEELYVDNSDNMEKISSDDSPKYNGHNQICMPALTPSCKRKGDTSVGFSMRLRSRKGEAVLLDGDTPNPESAEETSNKSAGKLYYPTREHPNSVEISSDDIKCLEPESLLSSPIMNFYIMYLQGPTSSTVRPKGDYHIFNTYFFSKLEAMTSTEDKNTYFLKLRRWWKGVDIFQKAYILLPVHADAHWSLVIICMPAKDDQTGPIILHLDSLKFHNSRLIFGVVSRFLKEEWSYLNENVSLTEFPLRETVWKNLPRKIEKKKIEVPQQENDYDCGLFVLYYMQRLIQKAPGRLHKKDLSMFGKHWFRPEEPSRLRLEIRRLILSCGEAEPKNDATELSFGEAEPKNGTSEPSRGES